MSQLKQLHTHLNETLANKLDLDRSVHPHPVTKGDAAEDRWRSLLQTYLPRRYAAEKAFVIDAKDALSEQIDIVVFDQQYSSFIFREGEAKYIPAESVYAVFEVKQELSKDNVTYAGQKIASVRALSRTSAPIHYAAGKYTPKSPGHILGGLLATDSSWNPPAGKPLLNTLTALPHDHHVDLGLAAKSVAFEMDYAASSLSRSPSLPCAWFLYTLLNALQKMGTVPAIDFLAYRASI